MSETLFDKLSQYSQSDYYPFHMPGHKRNHKIGFLPFEIDITEIEGFDNLHHPKGMIQQAQKRAAKLYGSEETYYLINGSTAGILAGISAATSMSGKIIMARNCHKAAYNAAFLKELEVVYLYPELEETFGIHGGIPVAEVERQLKKNPDAQAVIITSPTYDGIVSDIRAIATLVHAYNIPLIVDEAHGAHFGFLSGKIPENSIRKGADIVIHSLHKTLPSMTQTGLVHVNGSLVDRGKLRKYLRIYQSSSPSYVMMAGMDACMQLIEKQGRDLFDNHVSRLESFRKKMMKLEHLIFFDYGDETNKCGIYETDMSKLLIFTANTTITGKRLYDVLLEKYHIQMEMATGHYVLGVTSIMDTKEGFERLENALFEIDSALVYSEKTDRDLINLKQKRPNICMKAAQTEKYKREQKYIKETVNRISTEYVYRYPPGIPLVVPGEMITEEIIKQIMNDKKAGLTVEGMEDESADFIYVLDDNTTLC